MNKCFISSSCYMSIAGCRGTEFVVVIWNPRLMRQTLSNKCTHSEQTPPSPPKNGALESLTWVVELCNLEVTYTNSVHNLLIRPGFMTPPNLREPGYAILEESKKYLANSTNDHNGRIQRKMICLKQGFSKCDAQSSGSSSIRVLSL